MNSENDNTSIDVTTSGALDDFLNANGPLSVTIRTEDKTAAEMSFLTSPDIISLLPLSELSSQDEFIDSSHDREVEGVTDNSRSSPEFRNFVRIKIESSVEKHSDSFHIAVPMMLQREVEMQGAARANGIGKERWTSSRIFRMWKSQYARQQQRVQMSGEIILRMTPEISLRNTSSSCSTFRWKPWLTTCIRSYYNTGNLRIPDECTGDDILLAMQYFGILTSSPDNFVFDSKDAYNRIQAWSRYFTHRADLAECFLESYDDAEAVDSSTLAWVLVDEECTDDGKYEYDVIRDGENSENLESDDFILGNTAVRKFIIKSSGDLFELLSDVHESVRAKKMELEECENGSGADMISKMMPSRMRQDFCLYLRESLPPWSEVKFAMERVRKRSRIEANGVEHINATYQTKLVICVDRDRHKISKTTRRQKENDFSHNFNDSRNAKSHPGSGNMASAYSSDDQVQLLYGRVDETKSFFPKDKNNVYPSHKLLGVATPENELTNNSIASGKTFSVVKVMENANTSDTETFSEIPSRTPMAFVSMELGDLRSVTSVLSEPIVDYGIQTKKIPVNHDAVRENQEVSPILVTAKRILQERSGRLEQKIYAEETKRIEQHYFSSQQQCVSGSNLDLRIETPPRTLRNLLTPPPWDLDAYAYGAEDKLEHKAWRDDSNRSSAGDAMLRNERTTNAEKNCEDETPRKRDANEWEDENSCSKCEGGATELHGTWGQILASMCEGMIPVDTRNILSSSPTRNFTVTSDKSTATTIRSSDVEYLTARRCPSSDSTEFRSKPIGIVDRAKKFGNHLSDQLDELMKIAYNEIHQEDMNSPGGLEPLSPIFEEVPAMLAIDADEDHTLSSCLTTSIVEQPCKIQGSEACETGRDKDEEHLSGVIPLSSDTGHLIPKSEPFQLNPTKIAEIINPHITIRIHDPELEGRDVSVTRKKFTRKMQRVREYFEADACAKKGSIDLKDSSDRVDTFCRASSISEELSGISLKSYNKENRYSRQKNRFYS
mmetsp:Transcript_12807/g.29943  ORF Transcript_12807/g.29943 Transcript_12807/m.29943 type:complete len:1006 (+) Transcript_12807:195-3212(+)